MWRSSSWWRAVGWLATRVGQPRVIGEIVGGILFGPTVLGRIVDPSSILAPANLVPKEVPLTSIANLGLIFFMFLVGLELDSSLVKKEGRRAVWISQSGIALPLALGFGVGLLLAGVNATGGFMEGVTAPPKPVVFALFLGSAMCITAFPVLARILVETRLYKTAVGAVTLCAAAVDDATAWILLAGVVGIARTGSPAEAGVALALTAVYVLFLFVVGRRLLDVLARRYDRWGRLTVDQVALILAGVLLSAFITERIGIHAIFGAFLLGAIMPRRSGMTRELTDKVEDITVAIFLPVFFSVTGLRTNLLTLNSPALIGWLALILAAAIIGKFVGCGLAARLTGSRGRDAVVIGALMNTRGLTELVILSVGLNLGVLSDRTFAMMVIMAVVTTVMAAPIVIRLTSRDRVRLSLEASGELPHAEKSLHTTRILVALGNPANAGALVDAAIRLTGGRRPAELLMVRLIPTSRAPEFRTGLLDEQTEVSASIESMRRLVAQAEAAGVTARPLSFLSDDIGGDLARLAREQRCDLMLLGWHRPSLPRELVRALAHRAFRLAPCPVVVFVDRDGRGIIPQSDRPVVADSGARLAADLDAGLHLLGYVGGAADVAAASQALALRADEVRRATGVWVTPEFLRGDGLAATVTAVGASAVSIVGAGADWATSTDFGRVATDPAALTTGPLLVVLAAGETAPAPEPGVGYPRPPRPWGRRRRPAGRRLPVHRDLHGLTLAAHRQRYAHVEHAVLVLRRDGGGVHAVREREGAAEAATEALGGVVARLLRLLLLVALAGDGKHATADIDGDVLLLDARQLGLHHQGAVRLVGVRRR
ncbi:MAG: cation:proton antiporter [Dehalococcoidia bacterium]